MGPGFAIYSGILVLGAAAQPRFPRSGRVLTYIGALILSVVILPYGAGIVLTVVRELHRHHEYNYSFLGLITLWVLSVVFVTWCDVALVIEAIKANGPRQTQKT
jgi:hypothetical protein